MAEVVQEKVYDPAIDMDREVRWIENPVRFNDLVEPSWPDGQYVALRDYYLTDLQGLRNPSEEFNISIVERIAAFSGDDELDELNIIFDDLMNRFIYFWQSYEYMANTPQKEWGTSDKSIKENRAISEAMLAMSHEVYGIHEQGENMIRDMVRYFMRLTVRREEMEHPIRKLKHKPMESFYSHAIAIQAVDLFLLRIGIDILRVPFAEIIETAETDFEREQFASMIIGYNS